MEEEASPAADCQTENGLEPLNHHQLVCASVVVQIWTNGISGGKTSGI
jgi:hypothetical protein